MPTNPYQPSPNEPKKRSLSPTGIPVELILAYLFGIPLVALLLFSALMVFILARAPLR